MTLVGPVRGGCGGVKWVGHNGIMMKVRSHGVTDGDGVVGMGCEGV